MERKNNENSQFSVLSSQFPQSPCPRRYNSFGTFATGRMPWVNFQFSVFSFQFTQPLPAPVQHFRNLCNRAFALRKFSVFSFQFSVYPALARAAAAVAVMAGPLHAFLLNNPQTYGRIRFTQHMGNFKASNMDKQVFHFS